MPEIKVTIQDKTTDQESTPVFMPFDRYGFFIWLFSKNSDAGLCINTNTGKITDSIAKFTEMEKMYKKMRIKEIILEEWE